MHFLNIRNSQRISAFIKLNGPDNLNEVSRILE